MMVTATSKPHGFFTVGVSFKSLLSGLMACAMAFWSGRQSRPFLDRSSSLPAVRTLLEVADRAMVQKHGPKNVVLETTRSGPAPVVRLGDQWHVDVFRKRMDDPSHTPTLLALAKELEVVMLEPHCYQREHDNSSTCVGLLVPAGQIILGVYPTVVVLDLLVETDTLEYSDLEVLVQMISGHDDVDFRWAMKHRGFAFTYDNPEADYDDNTVMGNLKLDRKQHVAQVESDFQTIDIYDIMEPRRQRLADYERSLSDDGSYQATHAEFFQPDRLVFMDQVMQSRRRGEGAYHESLVHPALLALCEDDDPRSVAIIGGGEGATLREVLKHRWVERAVMIEIDEVAVNVSREYLPEWSDCSDIVGSTDSCFDDPRAEVVYADAIAWFIDRFGRQADPSDHERFNVIIMDALDPTSVVDFSDALYNNDELVYALSNALTPEGILVAQVGESQYIADPSSQFQRSGVVQESFMALLQRHGFTKAKTYNDYHGGFAAPWGYLAVFKDSDTSEHWHENEAYFNLMVRQRILPSKSGEPLLRYFDGATMQEFKYPSRVDEETYCRKTPTPPFCEEGHGYNPNRDLLPVSTFDVRQSNVPNAGRGVFFQQGARKGTYIAVDATVNNVVIFARSRKMLKQLVEDLPTTTLFSGILTHLVAYGWVSSVYGDPIIVVDCSIMTFMNHGCNGTSNLGTASEVNELTADPNEFPEELQERDLEDCFWSPFVERNFAMQMGYGPLHVANRDIEAGEELFDNYLRYYHEENWHDHLLSLRNECLQVGIGFVVEYETAGKVAAAGAI